MAEREYIEGSITSTQTDDVACGITDEAVSNGTLSSTDIKRNMIFCIMLDVIFMSGWADFQIAFQPLLVYLNASNTMIGIITGASFAGLLGIILSPWISRRYTYKKWYFFWVNVPYMGAIAVMGLVLVMSASLELSKEYLLTFILVAMLAHQFLSGFCPLPHQEYLAACIPANIRGRFTGYSVSFGALGAIGVAALGGYILSHLSKPASFGYVFLLTWFICQGGFIFALFAKEKPVPVEKSPKPWSKDMLKAVWSDKPFFRILMFIALFDVFVVPVFGYVNIYGFRELGMPASTAAIIQIIVQVVRISIAFLIGIATDRLGPKRLMPIGILLGAASLLPPILIRNAYGVYISVALSTFFLALMSTSFNKLIFGLPKPEHRAGHFTAKYIQQYSASAVGPILMGFAIDHLSYRMVFAMVVVVLVLLFPIARFAVSLLRNDQQEFEQS